ncbi:YfhO family protein [Bacillus sp. AGMB 02131]|uniref:YfhO family protein n=1 Tax=Peribacillus faecalis TaxID=2772559 RepID=A0A927HD87_9BACI|nr:YfhO family protein [Peribacillus faecalis]MBD3109193.1 YfhO family protein [Peribacillus faecalis]
MNDKDKVNLSIIIVVGLLFVATILGKNHLFGSQIDWLTQHVVFPDYFRQLFYETGNFIPNFASHIGGGQNVFNFSYYGLLNPFILLSYCFPFVEMAYYIGFISITLYLLTGLMSYWWFRAQSFHELLSLFLSLMLMMLAPILYHSHHHIMFVSYLPFLILAFIGVDWLIKHNQCWLLVLSTFLIIMTSYYYSVCAIIAIGIYYLYKYIKEYRRISVLGIWKIIQPMIISIFMSAVLLLPTYYAIKLNRSGSKSSYTWEELLIPRFDELLYKPFSVGITAVFLLAITALLFNRQKDFYNKFLAAVILIGSTSPFIMLILNGGMYIRGKALIPLAPIFCLILGIFIDKLQKKELNSLTLAISFAVMNGFIYLTGYTEMIFYIDSLIAVAAVLVYKRINRLAVLFVPILLLAGMQLFAVNEEESYVSVDDYKEARNEQAESLIAETIEEDNGYYRFSNAINKLAVANQVYGTSYYGTSIYSSVGNTYYSDFYKHTFGNNLNYRNILMNAGTDNTLFHSYMGVKYIVSKKDDIGFLYEKIASEGDVNLFVNENAFPMIYGSSKLTNESDFDRMSYPDTLNYLLNTIIVDDDVQTADVSTKNLKVYESDKLKDVYEFEAEETTTYKIELDEPVNGQLLLIQFDNEAVNRIDTSITINGMKNKLTAQKWRYHNQNNSFEYVLSGEESIEDLKITVTKGRYRITNLKIYTMEIDLQKSIDELDEFKITELNHGKSTIKGTITMSSAGYVATSYPFDKGFTVYADGKEIEVEKVNTAFLGFKLSEGEHEVKIVYHSPLLKEGAIASAIGLLLFIFIIAFERKRGA